MKYKKVMGFLILISCMSLCIYYYKNISLNNSIKVINESNIEKKYVCPLGKIVGIKATTDGILVIGYEEENVEYIGGIKIGDNIVYINDRKIEKIQDVSDILKNLDEDSVKITFIRDNKYINENVKLKKNGEDKKLGFWVRDKISGIGTMTFYDPQSLEFKGIGHSITDFDTNELIKIKQGYIYTAKKLNVEKGNKEKVGYLYGDFDLNNPIGEFKDNSDFGITGIYNIEKEKSSQLMEVGNRNDIKLGKAHILLEDKNNNIVSYDININNIELNKKNNKQISLEVTDERLIEYTGGIVQGMSGAPIIQNNKIIGALTHVFKDNSKKGYGIFIEEMIKLENRNKKNKNKY